MATSKEKTVERVWGALMSDQTIIVGDDLDTRVELYEAMWDHAKYLARNKEAVVELVDRFWDMPGLTFVIYAEHGSIVVRAHATFTKLKAAEAWAEGKTHRGIRTYDWKRQRWVSKH